MTNGEFVTKTAVLAAVVVWGAIGCGLVVWVFGDAILGFVKRLLAGDGYAIVIVCWYIGSPIVLMAAARALLTWK